MTVGELIAALGHLPLDEDVSVRLIVDDAARIIEVALGVKETEKTVLSDRARCVVMGIAPVPIADLLGPSV